jgi:hypothetical protein
MRIKRTKQKHWRATLFLMISLLTLHVPSAFSQVLTTLSVIEKAGVSTASYPLTFGHVFSVGEVSGNVFIDTYPTQTDVKSTWPDGSIKIAVVSALVPITANTTHTFNINDTGTQAGATPINKTEMLATDVGATIDLTSLSDSGYSGSLQADLRAQIDAASSFDYWLEGGVVSEILIQQALNASLDASWEVRFYPNTSYIRVSHSIENMKISTRGNVDYALEISQGNASPTSVYSKASFTHNDSSRWRKVFWLGSEPPEVEVHYDLDYWISTGLIFPYDTTVEPSESDIATHYTKWGEENTDLMGNGLLAEYFPSTGGRPEIGLLPKWCALYLLSMDNRMKEMVLGHGELAGGIPAHYKEDNATRSFYGQTINIDDYDYAITGASENLPAPIGTTDSNWSVDRSHQGSFAYLPYLITGEKFFIDEAYYWAGTDLAWDSYRRTGTGNNQSLASLIGDGFGTVSNGIIYDQMRAVAWGLRNISDAAVIAPHDSDEQNYFEEKAENNIQWLYLGNTGSNAHGLNAVRVPREHSTVDTYVDINLAPWMHDFIVIVLSDMKRKGLYSDTNISTLIDTIGKYTVGRFTNDPVFNKWDGAGYWWPLKMYDSVAYFDTDDWAQYWTDTSIYTGKVSKTDFSDYNYPYSYAYIARGALANLTNITGYDTAYAFLSNNLTTADLSEDPTWAFAPLSPLGDSVVQLLPPGNLIIE